ncbi:MAG: SDR family oxidoreductase [Myxococcales bacterium]|nr:SDR family oxidoreductase [Myxococcales bacterium]
MKNLEGKVAAITGASSGIGQELAIQLAAEGCNLALCDLNEAGLEATVARCQGVRVSRHGVDVSKREQVARFAQEALEQHGGVDLIINNAGITSRGTIEEHSYEQLEAVIGVDLWGVIYGVKEFLPLLRQRPEGHIVNISSINAAMPFPRNGPYNISKYGVAGLSDTLIQELAGSNIEVTCVHPGGIKTGLLENSGFDSQFVADFERIAMTTSAQAASAIIKGIKRNKKRLIVGADAKFLFAFKRLMPMTAVQVFGRMTDRAEAQIEKRAQKNGA